MLILNFVVSLPSLECSGQVGWALSDLVYQKVSLPTAAGWNFKVPSSKDHQKMHT